MQPSVFVDDKDYYRIGTLHPLPPLQLYNFSQGPVQLTITNHHVVCPDKTALFEDIWNARLVSPSHSDIRQTMESWVTVWLAGSLQEFKKLQGFDPFFGSVRYSPRLKMSKNGWLLDCAATSPRDGRSIDDKITLNTHTMTHDLKMRAIDFLDNEGSIALKFMQGTARMLAGDPIMIRGRTSGVSTGHLNAIESHLKMGG
ncbi:hypothetical protein BDY21DRAFT_370483 [Lineolata rhizophorae]|uniref:Uncharacterized protein n=1 Tax=Lineolata rhizophorae TaxID=578093 RepID=A0A6A6P4P3_9PEZI|nr:hypothetical protein BDY21DRAFT_370483 [Lineolata rhizophorae]